MPPGICRRNSVANASERLHYVSNDKLFNDQEIVHPYGVWLASVMQKESARYKDWTVFCRIHVGPLESRSLQIMHHAKHRVAVAAVFAALCLVPAVGTT